jgi:hypothetical protein
VLGRFALLLLLAVVGVVSSVMVISQHEKIMLLQRAQHNKNEKRQEQTRTGKCL